MILSDIKKLIAEKLETENRKSLNESAKNKQNLLKGVASAKRLLESENKIAPDYQNDRLFLEEEEFLNEKILEEIASSSRARLLAGTGDED